MERKKTVLLCVTGGIAAYKIATLASMLVKTGYDVKVVMTQNATNFINPLVFETLTQHKCLIDTFDRNFEYSVEHVTLAKWADIVMIAPATANVIGKLAHGIADDMLTTTVMACAECKKILAPAMNTRMYENPVVQDNLKLLEHYGYEVIQPASGHLACGDNGAGKMPEAETLYEYIYRDTAYEKDLTGKKILVTAGPTREAIDPVRYITNHSSGKMGYALARVAVARKILAVSLTAAMTLALAACGGSSSDKESSSKDSSDKVYKIGICQQLEHAALDEATKGFEEACEEKFGKDKVKFDLQNGQGEQANCATIVNNFVADNDDLILANATTALQCAAAATSTIPILGTSVTDYATALDISDWTGSTGMNISGTCDLAPIDEQEAMLKELLPDAKTVGILYCSAEPNSAYQAKKFEEALEKDGIKYKEYTAADSNEIQSVVTSAVDECDALYIPTDNTMASNTEIINNICLPAKVPVIAGEQGICEGCGIATLSISYYDIGYRAGEMAYDILVNGKDISTMDIESAPNVTKMYNKTICDELGITVPDDYEAIEE